MDVPVGAVKWGGASRPSRARLSQGSSAITASDRSLAEKSDSEILSISAGLSHSARLERDAPTHFTAPTGASLPIDYAAEQGPTIAVRLQELFGLNVNPSIANGR